MVEPTSGWQMGVAVGGGGEGFYLAMNVLYNIRETQRQRKAPFGFINIETQCQLGYPLASRLSRGGHTVSMTTDWKARLGVTAKCLLLIEGLAGQGTVSTVACKKQKEMQRIMHMYSNSQASKQTSRQRARALCHRV